jgi:hypothetical protein
MMEAPMERGVTSDETTIAVTGTPAVAVALGGFPLLSSLHRSLDHL